MCDDAVERMSPDLPVIPGQALGLAIDTDSLCYQGSPHSPSDQPRDLSIRRKFRPVPPPLDLSKRTLDHPPLSQQQQQQLQAQHDQQPTSPSPRSPFMQKNLPLRKRAHSWSSQPGNLSIPNCTSSTSSIHTVASTITTIKDEEGEPIDDYSYCKSSSNTSLRIPGLPTPHTPHTPHPHSAIPILTSKFNFSESSMAGSGSGQTATPLNLSTGGGLPSSLLSPAPSHPSTSSLSSSREELEAEAMLAEPSASSGYHHHHHHQHHQQHHHSSSNYHLSHHPYHSTSQQHYTSSSSPMLHQEERSSHYVDLLLPEGGGPPAVNSVSYLKQELAPPLYNKVELAGASSSVLYTQPEEHSEEDLESSEMSVANDLSSPSLLPLSQSSSSRLYSIKDEYHPDHASSFNPGEDLSSRYHSPSPHPPPSSSYHYTVLQSASIPSNSRYSSLLDGAPSSAFTGHTDIAGESKAGGSSADSNSRTLVAHSSGSSSVPPYHLTSPHQQHSHQWPTTVWSIFMAGVRIHFVLGHNQVTSVRLSEELHRLEEHYQQHYAPYGLQLLKCISNLEVNTVSGSNDVKPSNEGGLIAHLYLRPLTTSQEDIMALVPVHHPFFVKEKGWCSVNPELCRQLYSVPCSQLAEGDVCVPPHHPEHSSAAHLPPHPEHMPSHPHSSDLLHPHPEHTAYTAHSDHPPTPSSMSSSSSSAAALAHTHTPDYVADAIRRFDFSDEPVLDARTASRLSGVPVPGGPSTYSSPPPSSTSLMHYGPPPPPTSHSHHYHPPSGQYTSLTAAAQRSVFLSPPASPSKKSLGGGLPRPPSGDAAGPSGPPQIPGGPPQQVRPRRPMNGFMLFAKHHRLKLIQQHPGKDNRAISVLLGATWKALPEHERERINGEARLQAEARKLIDPDCWKRKRSHSTS